MRCSAQASAQGDLTDSGHTGVYPAEGLLHPTARCPGWARRPAATATASAALLSDRAALTQEHPQVTPGLARPGERPGTACSQAP